MVLYSRALNILGGRSPYVYFVMDGVHSVVSQTFRGLSALLFPFPEAFLMCLITLLVLYEGRFGESLAAGLASVAHLFRGGGLHVTANFFSTIGGLTIVNRRRLVSMFVRKTFPPHVILQQSCGSNVFRALWYYYGVFLSTISGHL